MHDIHIRSAHGEQLFLGCLSKDAKTMAEWQRESAELRKQYEVLLDKYIRAVAPSDSDMDVRVNNPLSASKEVSHASLRLYC